MNRNRLNKLIDADALEHEMEKKAVLGPDSKIPTWSKAMCCIDDAPAVIRSAGWIRDRVPENEDRVLCCTVTTKGVKNIIIGYYMSGQWRCGMNSNVIAWMPLPDVPEG